MKHKVTAATVLILAAFIVAAVLPAVVKVGRMLSDARDMIPS